MQKSLIAVFFTFISLVVNAQTKYDNLFLFDKEWNNTIDYNKCAYILVANKMNDTVYTNRYYTKTGPMIKWETFKDEANTIPHGTFAYYNKNGLLDSIGKVVNGRKDDMWFYYNNDKVVMGKKYNYGKFIKTYDYLKKIIIYPDGREEAIEKPKEEKDTTSEFSVVQVAAEYNGGAEGWITYVSTNITTPERFTNLQTGNYKNNVLALFNIDKEGNVTEIFIEKSVELSVDSEVIRVLRESPKWTPAVQNGRNVIYRNRQSFTFSVSEE